MSLLAALALVLDGTPGLAGRWWYLFSDTEMVWFADTVTLSETEGVVDITYQTFYRNPDDDRAFQVSRALVNCASRRMATISRDAFDIEGNPGSRSGISEWRTILPDSYGESLWLFACNPLTDWHDLGGVAVFRAPERVGRDFYWLIGLGLETEDAIGLARYDRATRLREIDAFIRARTKGELQVRLLKAYGLPGAPVT